MLILAETIIETQSVQNTEDNYVKTKLPNKFGVDSTECVFQRQIFVLQILSHFEERKKNNFFSSIAVQILDAIRMKITKHNSGEYN